MATGTELVSTRPRKSPGSARALHQSLQRRRVHAQHERDSEHTLVAYQADFEIGMAVDRSNQ